MTSYVAVLTFPQEAEAYQAFSELKSSPVSTEVQAAAIVKRDADGRLSLPELANDAGSGYTTGSLIGLVVGILGGPLGMLFGWGTGALLGGISDVERASTELSALLALSKGIPPNSNALILQTQEDSLDALDHFAADHGATVTREPLDQVLDEAERAREAEDEARKAAEKKLREERHAEDKQKWDERIAKLKEKLHL